MSSTRQQDYLSVYRAAHKEETKAYNRAYYAAHRDEISSRKAEHYLVTGWKTKRIRDLTKAREQLRAKLSILEDE